MAKEIKVLHVSTAKSFRGGEQQLWHVVTRTKGLNHMVLCSNKAVLKTKCDEETIEQHHLPKNFFARIVVCHHIINKSHVEIVHAHDAKAHTAVYYAKLLGANTKLIAHRRVIFPIGSSWLKQLKYRSKTLNHMVSVSKSIDGQLAKLVPASKRSVISSGIVFSQKQNDIRLLAQLPPDAFVFLNVAALDPKKGQLLILKAFGQWVKDRNISDAYLLFAGSGDATYKQQLMEEINRLQLNQSVTFLGFVNGIQDYMASANIFVFASHSEGLGTSVLDAMAARLPVISTAVGGLKEYLVNDKNALLFAVDDQETLVQHIDLLYSEPNKANQLADKAYNDALPYSIEHTIEQTKALYLKLAGI